MAYELVVVIFLCTFAWTVNIYMVIYILLSDLSAGMRSVFLQRIALIDASKRKDDLMDIIPIQCPHCLGELEVNRGVGTAVRLYCRGKMVIKLPLTTPNCPVQSPDVQTACADPAGCSLEENQFVVCCS